MCLALRLLPLFLAAACQLFLRVGGLLLGAGGLRIGAGGILFPTTLFLIGLGGTISLNKPPMTSTQSNVHI